MVLIAISLFFEEIRCIFMQDLFEKYAYIGLEDVTMDWFGVERCAIKKEPDSYRMSGSQSVKLLLLYVSPFHVLSQQNRYQF